MTGIFVGAEGAYGIMTECTLRMFPFPKKIYLERYRTKDLAASIKIFRELALNNLVCYVSVPVIKPGELIIFDVNIEGDENEVDARIEKVRGIVMSYPGIECLGPEPCKPFWDYRWFLTGEEFKDGIAGAVNVFLPFDKLENATYEMKALMDQHGIKHYAQQMFPEPHGSEHVSLMFFHPDDQEMRAKVWTAMAAMMDRALELGGAPYSKGRQWGPHLKKHLGNTGYWRLLETVKQAVDPNHIMNPGVVGLD
jgi:alkyldihydroxyacetonephosphate synthase